MCSDEGPALDLLGRVCLSSFARCDVKDLNKTPLLREGGYRLLHSFVSNRIRIPLP